MALKQSEAQFQRSGPATPDPSPKKRVVVDGEKALEAFTSTDKTAADMSGAEYFAVLEAVKSMCAGGEALEAGTQPGEVLAELLSGDVRGHVRQPAKLVQGAGHRLPHDPTAQRRAARVHGLTYVDQCSFRLDLQILVATAMSVVRRTGV